MFTYGLDTLHRKLSQLIPVPVVRRAIDLIFNNTIDKIHRDAKACIRMAGPDH